MFRLEVDGVHFNGGFGRALPLAPADILAPREGEAALTEAEPTLVAEINARGPAYVARLAGAAAAGRRVRRAVGLDLEGLDLSAGKSAGRVQFPARPATRPAGARGSREAGNC